MRYRNLFFIAAALAIGLLAVATVHATAEAADESIQTFEGKYDWTNGSSDSLTARFTPDGENSWRVKFDFRFDGENNTWDGTAQGSLEDGAELNGTASWRGRNWTFDAVIEEGVMRGTHVELRGEKERRSGTFELEWQH